MGLGLRVGGLSAMSLRERAKRDVVAPLESTFSERFVQAADDAGLPDDPEFPAGLRAYMEWAVNEVLYYSPAGATVPSSLPVPRWGWNGLEKPADLRMAESRR